MLTSRKHRRSTTVSYNALFPSSTEATSSPSCCPRLCHTALPTGWICGCSDTSVLSPSHARPPIVRQLLLRVGTETHGHPDPSFPGAEISTAGLKWAASPPKGCWHRPPPNMGEFPRERHLSVKTFPFQPPKKPTDFSSSLMDLFIAASFTL